MFPTKPIPPMIDTATPGPQNFKFLKKSSSEGKR